MRRTRPASAESRGVRAESSVSVRPSVSLTRRTYDLLSFMEPRPSARVGPCARGDRLMWSRAQHDAEKESVHDEAAHGPECVRPEDNLAETRVRRQFGRQRAADQR